jgi:hypothetical protein
VSRYTLRSCLRQGLYDLLRRRCRTDLYKGFIASLGSILVVVSRVLETLGIEGESQLISELGAACLGHPGQWRPRKAGPGLLLALYTSNPLHLDPVAPGSCVTGSQPDVMVGAQRCAMVEDFFSSLPIRILLSATEAVKQKTCGL